MRTSKINSKLRLTRLPLFSAIKAYCMLTKPGIIMGNALTATAGFALASRGTFNPWLFIATMIGLALIIGAACVFNNIIDRELDGKMERTKNRPLVLGLVSPKRATVYATILGLLGTFLLIQFTNLLTTLIALLGVFFYVVVYTYAKYQTVQGTLIGSISGAIPPVVGYVAVTNRLDAAALILFFMIVLWQMPHFFAIALYRLEDYARGNIPVFPIKKGILKTKIHMFLYVFGFLITALLLAALSYTGFVYLMAISLTGLAWLYLAIKGFTASDSRLWARKMFFFSLVVVMALSLTIPFSVSGFC